jgi:hypothetical protein
MEIGTPKKRDRANDNFTRAALRLMSYRHELNGDLAVSRDVGPCWAGQARDIESADPLVEAARWVALGYVLVLYVHIRTEYAQRDMGDRDSYPCWCI